MAETSAQSFFFLLFTPLFDVSWEVSRTSPWVWSSVYHLKLLDLSILFTILIFFCHCPLAIGGLADLGNNTSLKEEGKQGKTSLQDIQEQKEDKRESDSSSCMYLVNTDNYFIVHK